MRRYRTGCFLGGLAVAGLLIACGSDDAPARATTGPGVADARSSRAENAAPRIDDVALSPANPAPGDILRAVVEASDADGDPVSLSFRWTVSGRTVPKGGPEITLGNAAKGSTVEVVVTASDGRAESEPRSASTTLANRAPRLRSVGLQPEGTIEPGTILRAVVDAADPDGDPLQLEYTWLVNDREFPEEGSSLSTGKLKRGDSVRLRVVASDGWAWSDKLESPSRQMGNAPPAIVSQPTGLGKDGRFRYAVRAEDPDGDFPLRYRLVLAPPGMKLDPTDGEITWQPSLNQAGTHPVEIEVEDPLGALTSQRFSLTIDVVDAQPPAEAN